MSDLCLAVLKELRKRLYQVVVRDLLAEGVGELGEVLGKAKAYLPGLVLAGGQKSTERVDLVFLFGEILGHGDERLEAHNSNSILLILRQGPEDWQNLLKHMLLI